jgi:hypothetical protein
MIKEIQYKDKKVMVNTDNLSFSEALMLGLSKKEYENLTGKHANVRGNIKKSDSGKVNESDFSEKSGKSDNKTDSKKAVSKRKDSKRTEAKD